MEMTQEDDVYMGQEALEMPPEGVEMEEEEPTTPPATAGEVGHVDMSEAMGTPDYSLDQLLAQLTEVATQFVTSFRENEAEGERIQAELDELHQEQNARCQGMVQRLELAGNTLFAFGQDENPVELEGNVAESQEMDTEMTMPE
ncbi:hypothetical protein Poli38472_013435 [Pythium oligandrum]|uniref:Uncharacterized protein n=1 Tax=Pythium oligandrum TaxID=41045 RepID=A0A8K1FD60_PYTOL|nr:hypothetical protein Poli38472_013435 [Pythium oligandrum]|eukprot:TMW57961.1 hypothetical protein Poli38472_013435 [Pythium oligandrum]